MKEIPAQLRALVAIHMNKKIVEKIQFLEDKDPAFVSSLVTKLKSMHLLSGEYVYRIDEQAEEIYFIIRG